MLLHIETQAVTRAFDQRTGILHLRQDFELQTLGPMEMNIACKAMNVVGSRLIASVSARVTNGTAVSIRCEDSLLLGEVVSSWFEKGSFFAVIELQQVLTCPASRFWPRDRAAPPARSLQNRRGPDETRCRVADLTTRTECSYSPMPICRYCR